MSPFIKIVYTTAILLTLSISISPHVRPAGQTNKRNTRTIFVFHTDEFWLNLHHFLYVLGRAENKERDMARDAVAGAPADQERALAKLSAKDQKVWREAVISYAAGPSKKDIVFDEPLPAVPKALSSAGNAQSLSGAEIDPAIATILESAAPIYRKAWWQRQQEANRRWQKSIKALLDRHGLTILAFITNAYKMEWPTAGFNVHVSGYANWAGAYSTTGNLLVLSSQSLSLQGLYGLETIFHEGMHQWDDQMFEVLREQAGKVKKFFPRGLDHALIFYTAGEAVRRAVDSANPVNPVGSLDRAGPVEPVSGSDRTGLGSHQEAYVPYAEKFGVWQRGWGSFKTGLDEIWKPYLDGQGARDETLAALINRTGIIPSR